MDGRDPQIDGLPFELPRRERRILEYLYSIEDAERQKANFSTLFMACSTKKSMRT